MALELDLAAKDSNGRINLSRTCLSEVRSAKIGSFGDYDVRAVDRAPGKVSNRNISGVDFSGSLLPGLRFDNCTISDCSFDDSTLDSFFVYRSVLKNCSFRRCRIEDANIGPFFEGDDRANHFERCHFGGSRLSFFIVAATFSECDFGDARIRNTDFEGAHLKNCTFSGHLEEVYFNRTSDLARSRGWCIPNTMEGCAFNHAQFYSVHFRSLKIPSDRLPTERHFIIQNWRQWISNASARLRQSTSAASKNLLELLLIHDEMTRSEDGTMAIPAEEAVDCGGEEAWQLLNTFPQDK